MKIDHDLDEAINILDRTPRILEAMLDGLPENWINNNEGGDSWSPFDIVGHLLHGEKTDWMERCNLILNSNIEATFSPFDRFAQFVDSKGKSMSELLSEFKSLRTKNLQELKSFGIEEPHYKMTAIHPDLGRVTLQQLLSTWVVHDLSHLGQIARVMAKQYKSQVGPWKEFINFIND